MWQPRVLDVHLPSATVSRIMSRRRLVALLQQRSRVASAASMPNQHCHKCNQTSLWDQPIAHMHATHMCLAGFSTSSRPPSSSASPSSQTPSKLSSARLQNLSMLVNDDATSGKPPQTQPAARVASKTTVGSAPSPAGFSYNSPGNVNSSPSPEAVASVAISHITPQFLVFIRDSTTLTPTTNSSSPPTPLTADAVLRFVNAENAAWTKEGGISARHIVVVQAGQGEDFSHMAGFPCHTAFYLTFPKHETRSPSRVRYLDHYVFGSKNQQSERLHGWGWKLIRYPRQMMIGLTSSSPQYSYNGTPQQKVREIVSSLRKGGFAGWDLLDDSFIEPFKTSLWLRLARGSAKFDYMVRVPPFAKYMSAISSIIQQAPQLKEKCGIIVEGGAATAATSGVKKPSGSKEKGDEVTCDIPVIHLKSQKRPDVPSSAAAPAAAESTAPAAAAHTRTVAPPSRFYFYFIDSHGRLYIEDEQVTMSASGVPLPPRFTGLGLRDRKALNIIYQQMRLSQQVMQRDPRLRDHQELLVPIPQASLLYQNAQAYTAQIAQQQPQSSTPAVASLPLNSISTTYPWLSLCAGEVNFLRCETVPVVFRAVEPLAEVSTSNKTAATAASDSTSASPLQHTHVLVYGGDLTMPFDPSDLTVDAIGRLFHQSPISSPTISIDQPTFEPSISFGLLASSLAQELQLHESPFTREEVDYSIRQAETTRRMTIEMQEEYQKLRETNASAVANQSADNWIRSRVQMGMKEAGLDMLISKFVITFAGKNYRIKRIDQVVGPAGSFEQPLLHQLETVDNMWQPR